MQMQVVQDIHRQVEEASGGYKLSLENVLQVGFNLFRKAPGEFIVFSIIGIFVYNT